MATTRPGFVLYVTLPDPTGPPATASPADPSPPDGGAARLVEAAEVLRELALDLLPAAETYTVLTTEPQRTDALLRLLAERPPRVLVGPGDAG
jgi:hypothetical protein